MASHFWLATKLRYLASEIFIYATKKDQQIFVFILNLSQTLVWQLSAGVVLLKQRMCTELGFGGISSNDLHEGIMTMEEMNVWYANLGE